MRTTLVCSLIASLLFAPGEAFAQRGGGGHSGNRGGGSPGRFGGGMQGGRGSGGPNGGGAGQSRQWSGSGQGAANGGYGGVSRGGDQSNSTQRSVGNRTANNSRPGPSFQGNRPPQHHGGPYHSGAPNHFHNRPSYHAQWHHGDWHGHWGRPWGYYPVGWYWGVGPGWGWGFAAGVATVGISVGSPWGWGYYSYWNPYWVRAPRRRDIHQLLPTDRRCRAGSRRRATGGRRRGK